MSFVEILRRAKRNQDGLPPEVSSPKRARSSPPPQQPAPPQPPPAPVPPPLPVPAPSKSAKSPLVSVPIVETETPPALPPAAKPPQTPNPSKPSKPQKPQTPKPSQTPQLPKPPDAEFVVAAHAQLAERARASKASTAPSRAVPSVVFAPTLDGTSNPHDLSPVLEHVLKHPHTRAVTWIAPPPKRAVSDALDLGLVLSARSSTGRVAHLGFDERPYAEEQSSGKWKALVDTLTEWRATDGKPATDPFGFVERFRGGFNSVLGFKPRANAADAIDLQSQLPAPMRTEAGVVDVATALVRVPLASTKSVGRAETVDASAALLDAAQSGFGVQVHALIPLYSLRSSASDAPNSPPRTTYESISVQQLAQRGDLGRMLLNLAMTSQPTIGRARPDHGIDAIGTPQMLRAVFASLKRCIFGYSMRRMIFFDGSPTNFVVDTSAHGSASVCSVHVVDLDPLEYRRLHVACADEPGKWTPWISEREDETAVSTDAVVGRCDGDADEADGGLAAPFALRLQFSAGQGWRPLFLLNSLFTLCMLRHRLASVSVVPDVFWHSAVYTREFAALLTRIRNEIPHVGTMQSGFGRVVPPRRLFGRGFRCEDRSAAFAAEDENKRVSEAFAADERFIASPSERAEYEAAAKLVQNARWAGTLEPAMTQVTRANRDTHSPDKLAATIVSMFHYYSLAYVVNETCKITTDVLLAEFAKPGGISNINSATNPRVASVVTAYRNYRQHTFPFLAFFARALVPVTMEATHSPLFVDVALEYCAASQDTLNASCVDRYGKPIVLPTAEELIRRFCAEPQRAFCTRERIHAALGIDRLVHGTSKFECLQ